MRKFPTVFRRKKITFRDPSVYRISDFSNTVANLKKHEEESEDNTLSECKKFIIMLCMYAYVAYIFVIFHYSMF